MKRNLLVIFILFLFGIPANAQKECNGGNHNPPKDNDHPYVPGPGTTTSGGASVDPNEIIGPTGFGDSIRWVSINDILNYTILFENDPSLLRLE